MDFNPHNAWQGQIGVEVGVFIARFARFDQAENGICALGKLLLNRRGKDSMPGVGHPGIDTPLEFISPWAPFCEQNTFAYAPAIANRLGVQDSIDISKCAVLREAVLGHHHP